MRVYHLLGRLSCEEMRMAIEKPESFVYQEGLTLRFFEGESKTLETKMKVEGYIRLGSGMHGLLGHGRGEFACSWLFIPGVPEVSCHLSSILIVLPCKVNQSFKQLQLELEAASIKALEPAPA